MEKSQGNLQNNVHLHDIVEEIKELANPLWISSVSLLQAHNQNEGYDIYEYYYF